MDKYDTDEIETAAAVFAKFARLLNPKVDELHAFRILRDYIVDPGIHLENMEDLVYMIQETFFDPTKDKLH